MTDIQPPIPEGAHVETVFEVRVRADLPGALRAVLTTRFIRDVTEITGEQVLVIGHKEAVGERRDPPPTPEGAQGGYG